MAQIVPIDRVIPRQSKPRVLERQGQIEPLQVTAEGLYYVTFDCDIHADAAAKELGWNTLLIVVTDVYEN